MKIEEKVNTKKKSNFGENQNGIKLSVYGVNIENSI
jgi:hypothetical protein